MSERCIRCNEKLKTIETVADIDYRMDGTNVSYKSLYYCNNHVCQNVGLLTLAYDDEKQDGK